MKLLICGGREFTDAKYAIPRFFRVHRETPVTEEICGMATGADTLGRMWAEELGIPVAEFKPDWNRYGRAAGPIRNQRMLEEGKPDCVLALPGGTGTAHMVKIAKAAGVLVIEYHYKYFSRARDPEWGFLSNFWPHLQTDDSGITYKTNEHWYQAEKTRDPEIRKWIAEAPDAASVKKRGNHSSVSLREDWETGETPHKIVAMRTGLRMKFVAGSELAEKLVQTGDLYLVEYSPWGDSYWGVDKNYKGQNWLGRLLMEHRDQLVAGGTSSP